MDLMIRLFQSLRPRAQASTRVAYILAVPQQCKPPRHRVQFTAEIDRCISCTSRSGGAFTPSLRTYHALKSRACHLPQPDNRFCYAVQAPRACAFRGLGKVAFGDDAQDALPAIDEEDLEESFVRGSGAGGQKINKTANCVQLKHKPTGIIVRCQETRSQTKNRVLARRILQRKLDDIVRGEQSLAAQQLSKARARKARRRRKSVKKHFKSRSDRALMDD